MKEQINEKNYFTLFCDFQRVLFWEEGRTYKVDQRYTYIDPKLIDCS